MCTIGHETLMHGMTMWQIRAALRGMGRQQRPLWEAARMVAFTQAKIGGAQIRTFADLMQFPWEKDNGKGRVISEEEMEECRRIIEEENKKLMFE